MSVEKKSSFTGSSHNKSVLRYFLLSSEKIVTTTASLPNSFCIFNAPKKFAPEDIPTQVDPNPYDEAIMGDYDLEEFNKEMEKASKDDVIIIFMGDFERGGYKSEPPILYTKEEV